ncbi:mannose-6-phosphate isomerase, class I [Corynebacterium poyangense]|uniref:mannose-6-phosphate isomerase n=1 Tax=Corynebacterium poyangense TaxID=2684405 RepID=A0A7H0SMI7_9CORY|nr:mannose-6-phosphate isomerase, class I [Corynebacterium poyangense]MBZ8176867.1 mannose-6-phosphate isomerase, class I [Corynebacterium poyangense]QNQ89762.1 mannose-6-phosphate isomerase, class I [Corynebacterium poyangense]
MQQLDGTIRSYPWGSRTMLAALQGRPVPADRPEAELWLGAHPMSPSTVAGRPLTEVIAQDPEGCLGRRVAQRFDNKLPFLLKLLAAEEPLSLQAHPSLAQAQDGFTRENEQNIDVRDPKRNYRDANHKPELTVALSPFKAMAGFRPLALTRELLTSLNCPELDRYLAMVDAPSEDPEVEEENLRALFTTWITIPTGVRETLVAAIIRAAKNYQPQKNWIDEVISNLLLLQERYPGDSGILGALLLNHLTLEPREAIHLAAGQLHAYIHGLGVEIQANSDNVLRGGLTSKYVDVPELVRVLDFHSLADPRTNPVHLPDQPGEIYHVPIPDFVLHRIAQAEDITIDFDGPVIGLCTAGILNLRTQGAPASDESELQLHPGQAVWIPADDPAITLSGGGEFFIATA